MNSKRKVCQIYKVVKFVLTLGTFCFMNFQLVAQQHGIDSLKNLLKTLQDDTAKVNILNALSDRLETIGSYDSSLLCANNAQTLAEKIGFKKGEANALRNIGVIYGDKGNYLKAMECDSLARVIYEGIGNKKGLADILCDVGNIYLAQANYSGALENYFKALNIKEEMKDTRAIAVILGNIANIYFEWANYPIALEYYDKALALVQEMGDKDGIAVNLGNIGNVYNYQADYPKALEYYFKALQIAEGIANKDNIASYLSNIGTVYNAEKSYPKALEYYFKALHIVEEIGNKEDIATSLGNIGAVYHAEKNYPEALEYYSKALTMAKETGDKNRIILNLRNIGAVYNEQGNYLAALGNYANSLNTAREIGSKFYLSSVYGDIGEFYLRQKNYKLSKAFLDSALNLSINIANRATIAQTYYKLSYLDSATGNYKNGWEDYKEYMLYRDSITNSETREKLIRFDMSYQFDKKAAVAQAEQGKTDVMLADEKRQNKIVSIALAVILILFVIAFVSFRRTRTLKNKLALSLTQKEGLLREIHHRVKNNLQFVSSLLSIQSRYIQDSKALTAVKESRDRVKAMALIHQDLYQQEKITQLNLKDYLTKLTENFRDSYQLTNIHFKTEADNLDMDVDIMIPLGLIINELITNSIKYAFADGQEGNIFISVKRNANTLVLQVQDNGSGFPKDFSLESSSSFGYRLIGLFKEKLKATLTFENRSGAYVQMIIPYTYA